MSYYYPPMWMKGKMKHSVRYSLEIKFTFVDSKYKYVRSWLDIGNRCRNCVYSTFKSLKHYFFKQHSSYRVKKTYIAYWNGLLYVYVLHMECESKANLSSINVLKTGCVSEQMTVGCKMCACIIPSIT